MVCNYTFSVSNWMFKLLSTGETCSFIKHVEIKNGKKVQSRTGYKGESVSLMKTFPKLNHSMVIKKPFFFNHWLVFVKKKIIIHVHILVCSIVHVLNLVNWMQTPWKQNLVRDNE